MRSKLYILSFILLVVFNMESQGQRLVFNRKAPPMQLNDYITGSEASSKKPSYILFLIHGNKANDAELARLSELASRHKNSTNFIVVVKGNRDKVKEYFDERITPYSVAMGSERLFDDFGVRYLPTGIILNKKGRFVWQGRTDILTDDILLRYK